jgi:hypothetical protein
MEISKNEKKKMARGKHNNVLVRMVPPAIDVERRDGCDAKGELNVDVWIDVRILGPSIRIQKLDDMLVCNLLLIGRHKSSREEAVNSSIFIHVSVETLR